MQINMGATDRRMRMLVAVLVFTLFMFGFFSETAGIILLIIAGIFFATSLLGFCPLYSLFRISSKKKPSNG